MEAPVNNKSLVSFLCRQMEQLDKGKITHKEAGTQCAIANTIVKIQNYELSRVHTEMKLREFNMANGSNISIRQLEQKGFDDTTHSK